MTIDTATPPTIATMTPTGNTALLERTTVALSSSVVDVVVCIVMRVVEFAVVDELDDDDDVSDSEIVVELVIVDTVDVV